VIAAALNRPRKRRSSGCFFATHFTRWWVSQEMSGVPDVLMYDENRNARSLGIITCIEAWFLRLPW